MRRVLNRQRFHHELERGGTVIGRQSDKMKAVRRELPAAAISIHKLRLRLVTLAPFSGAMRPRMAVGVLLSTIVIDSRRELSSTVTVATSEFLRKP
jgi:hypothetical protein